MYIIYLNYIYIYIHVYVSISVDTLPIEKKIHNFIAVFDFCRIVMWKKVWDMLSLSSG